MNNINIVSFVNVCLLLSASFIYLFQYSVFSFISASFLASIIGLLCLFFLVYKPKFVSFYIIMAVSLLIGYAISTSIISIVALCDGNSFNSAVHSLGVYYETKDIAMALIIVLLSAIILMQFSVLETPVVDKLISIKESNSCKYILISFITVFIAYIVGEIGFLGVQLGDKSNIGLLGSLSYSIVLSFLPIIVYDIVKAKSRLYKIFLFVVCIFFVSTCAIFGRRVFVYSLISVFICLSVFGIPMRELLFKRPFILFASIIILLVMIFFIFASFFVMRMASYYMDTDKSIFILLFGAVDVFKNSTSDLFSEIAANIIERPFILSYFAGLVSAKGVHMPLLGKEIEYAFLTAIPSFIFPNKLLVLPGMAEEFVHPAYGLPVFDGNNTILTAGFNDFGFLGALLYPVIMVLIFIGFINLSCKYLPAILVKMAVCRLIYQVLFVEETLAGLTTVCLRDLILAMVFIYTTSWLLDYVIALLKIILFKRPAGIISNG